MRKLCLNFLLLLVAGLSISPQTATAAMVLYGSTAAGLAG